MEEKNLTQERRNELDEANQLKDEVMQGLQAAEPAERLLLKAVHALSLMDGDSVSYEEAKRTLTAVYGDVLGQEMPLKIELEQYFDRLEKIKAYIERESQNDAADPDTVERARSAARAHVRRITALEDQLGLPHSQKSDVEEEEAEN